MEANKSSSAATPLELFKEEIRPPIRFPKLPAKRIIPIIAVQTKLLLPKKGDIILEAASSNTISAALSTNSII